MTERQVMRSAQNDLQENGEEIYEEERATAFYEQFEDMFVVNGALVPINEDDVQGFLDSFDFPDYYDWAIDYIEGAASDYGDYMYEQEKDRRMGL